MTPHSRQSNPPFRTVLFGTVCILPIGLGALTYAQVGPGFYGIPNFIQSLRPAPSAHSAILIPQHRPVIRPQIASPHPMSAPWGAQGPHQVQPQSSYGPTQRARGRGVDQTYADPNTLTVPSGSYGYVLKSHSGFRLSVDGQAIAGDGFNRSSAQNQVDRALERASVQVRVDGLDVDPQLNVGISGDATRVPIYRPVEFVAHTNYDAYIAYAEIRIFTPGREGATSFAGDNATGFLDTREPVLTVPVQPSGRAIVQLPPQLPTDLLYQLRVFDTQGRWDETVLKSFSTTDQPVEWAPDQGLGAYGTDATLRRNIRVRGSAVTVNGDQVPPGYQPYILGRSVPVDLKGRFVTQQILPFGPAHVRVDLVDPYGHGLSLHRDVELRDTDLFYVALGDLTIGQRDAIGLADLTDPGEDFDAVDVAGRGAFYLKGRIKGETLITAALDTGEAPIDELLSNLDDKDPRQLLRRLDSDAYYPVYGDNSSTREDAPTQGRFYIRLEQEDNTLLWGNFATAVTGTEIAQLDRGLYGALADSNSQAVTRFGERRTTATAFAADPGTLPGRDEFRGTGGSLYYLQRQDISVGSERLRVEVRDPLTGLIVKTQDLVAFEDYEIDYLQGRVVLTEPLESTVDDGQIIRIDGLSGHEAYLVARYEFTPGVSDLGGYTVGGRATHWLTDNLRVGFTGQNETTGTIDQRVLAGDVLLRATDNTFLKGEYGESRGPGFGESRSTDGGFLFDDITDTGVPGVSAGAYRVEGQVDAQDLVGRPLPVKVRFRGVVEHQDENYSGQGRTGFGEVDREDLSLDVGVPDQTSLSVRYTRLRSQLRGRSKSLYADLTQTVRKGVAIALGLRHSDQDPSTIANLSANSPRGTGQRTDGTVELRLSPSDDSELRLFYQDTLSRDVGRLAFARYGLRGSSRFGRSVRFTGEVSDGDGGIAANAKVSVQGSEGSEYYLGYALSADNQDDLNTTRREASANYGTITAGARHRYSDSLSIFGEEQISLGSAGRDLIHAYGVDFKPGQHWAFGASVEVGTIRDDILGDFDREAFSLSMARTGKILRFSSNFEARFEEGLLNGQDRDRTTYLLRNTVALDADQDLELLGRFNMAWSESDQDSILNSDYVEGVLAAAYRPVHFDRLNVLGKYTFFETLAPEGQLNGNQLNRTARQRSHIISVDGIYDVTGRLSVGAKGAYRMGEVEIDRGTNVFIDSTAWLGVARADYHIIDQWDVFAEAHYLSVNLSEDSRLGAVVGVHRHLNDHFKVGAGYSFASFSDDLTNFENNADGWFINVVGKM